MDNVAQKTIKRTLFDEDVKMVDLNDMLNKINGTNYNVSNLSQKINSGTIRYNDVFLIANLLGYDIIWKKRE